MTTQPQAIVGGRRLRFAIGAVLAGLVVAAAGSSQAAEVRALLVPRAETVLAAEAAGRVEQISVDMGQRFRRGQALVVLDSQVHKGRRAIAEAELEIARRTYESNRQLEKLQSVSTLEVAVSRARMQRAEAEMALEQINIAKCIVTAPFDGRVVRRQIQPFAYVTPGQPLLEIVADQGPEIQLLVPSAWLSWLRQGTNLTVRVDETGGQYQAVVTALGARIDPVSQTLEVRARFDGHPKDLLAGMSAMAIFKPPSQP